MHNALIPPRERCPQCLGRGSTTYGGYAIHRCWGCSGKGHLRDWHALQLAALQAGALLSASAAGAAVVAWAHGDMDVLFATVSAFFEVTP
ncbi:hypothetical protein GCM10010412_082540 [Nonomuraea recticatena]|uniref:Uncharacterized protein n=2 Tax=Nonomuraea recticatena TaxID=46178 RepID=A0ABN3T200_9ACTN